MLSIPLNLLESLKSCGATVKKLHDQDIYYASIISTDTEPFKLYEAFLDWSKKEFDRVNEVNGEFIYVTAGYLPPNQSDVFLGAKIQREANSIIYYMANSESIGPPINTINISVRVKMFNRINQLKMIKKISNPPESYTTIYNLPKGSYICTINYQYENGSISVNLFKS